MLTSQEILKISEKSRGINRFGVALKDYIQDKLLYYIANNCINCIFKGGTALFKIYHSPRISDDLDFDVVRKLELSVLNKIRNEIEMEGLNVRVIKHEKIIGGLVLREQWELSRKGFGSVTIRLEFKEIETAPSVRREYLSPYPDIKPFHINVYPIETILKRKVELVLERRKVRDLFDVYYIVWRYGLTIKITQERASIFLSRTERFRKSWKSMAKLLIGLELPDFDEVISTIKKAMEIEEN